MRIIKHALWILLLACSLVAYGQAQHGIVKSIGRPGKKGKALGGVTIRISGQHNAMVSDYDGSFAFVLSDKKEGDGFSLQYVQKKGYELNEKGVIGRQFAYSYRVPLTIVMVSTEQLNADIQRIENNAFSAAEKNYKIQMDLLEHQKNENQISIEKYRNEIQNLQEKFEAYQSLIESLAEHYAHTDYDNLDEQDRQINIYIENGELEKADSLIRVLFDPLDVIKRNKEALGEVEGRMAQAQILMDEANEDMSAVLRRQEKDANYLYQLYTISLARFDNQEAAHYICLRADLDTTNVQWQNDAGQFLHEHLADYETAITYFERGLRVAISMYGEQNDWVATLLNNIGTVYDSQGKDEDALKYYLYALEIKEQLLGTDHPETAKSYNNIGIVYTRIGDVSKALEYYSKALSGNKSDDGQFELSVNANTFNNLGIVYDHQGNYEKALEYYFKALAIQESLLGKNHLSTAVIRFSLWASMTKRWSTSTRHLTFARRFWEENTLPPPYLTVTLVAFTTASPGMIKHWNVISMHWKYRNRYLARNILSRRRPITASVAYTVL